MNGLCVSCTFFNIYCNYSHRLWPYRDMAEHHPFSCRADDGRRQVRIFANLLPTCAEKPPERLATDDKALRVCARMGERKEARGPEFARRGSASRIARSECRSWDYCKMSALLRRTCHITTIIYPSTYGVLDPQGGQSM
jgi:hypothetical protein